MTGVAERPQKTRLSRWIFESGRRARKFGYMRKGTTLRVLVATRPKLVFDQMAAPITELIDIIYILAEMLTASGLRLITESLLKPPSLS
jgi:hypothetical protein